MEQSKENGKRGGRGIVLGDMVFFFFFFFWRSGRFCCHGNRGAALWGGESAPRARCRTLQDARPRNKQKKKGRDNLNPDSARVRIMSCSSRYGISFSFKG